MTAGVELASGRLDTESDVIYFCIVDDHDLQPLLLHKKQLPVAVSDQQRKSHGILQVSCSGQTNERAAGSSAQSQISRGRRELSAHGVSGCTGGSSSLVTRPHLPHLRGLFGLLTSPLAKCKHRKVCLGVSLLGFKVAQWSCFERRRPVNNMSSLCGLQPDGRRLKNTPPLCTSEIKPEGFVCLTVCLYGARAGPGPLAVPYLELRACHFPSPLTVAVGALFTSQTVKWFLGDGAEREVEQAEAGSDVLTPLQRSRPCLTRSSYWLSEMYLKVARLRNNITCYIDTSRITSYNTDSPRYSGESSWVDGPKYTCTAALSHVPVPVGATVSEGVFKCPEDQLPLDYAKIYPDPELEQQILALPIRCIHSEEGCRCFFFFFQLQGHFSTCAFNVIPCPNRCSVKLTRRDLPDHLQHDCPKRKVKCEFCGSEFTGEAYENHQGVCPQESVYCENKCGARMMRRLLSQHSMAECPKRTQPCKYCGKEFVFDTIQNHQYHCPRFPVQCPNQCGTPNIAREDLANHVKDNCGSALVLCPFKDAGCKHRCPKLAIGRHLEDTTKSHLTMMCNLVGRQRQEILELRREMEELSVSHDGVLIWKLNDYSRKLQEAKLRSNHEFFSPPFYTHRYGYKLQVSAFLNGNGSGEGSHLSVYIRVLPGEYDSLLEWPFSYKVTFSIMDQSDPSLSKPQHITETFNPDPNWKNFQKPCSSRNSLDESTLGFGYPKFISHEEIKKRNYIRDNCIFIKASIEIPQKIMA
nr:TRAF4 [Paralichthys olivaceus]